MYFPPVSSRFELLCAEAERHSHQSDAVQALPESSPGSRLLFIGDSISCGYASPQMLIPHGSLDAFTSRASGHLGIPYDIIAYPGITLVGPTASGVSFIHREPGMVSRFFLVRAERLLRGLLPLPLFLRQIVSLNADACFYTI